MWNFRELQWTFIKDIYFILCDCHCKWQSYLVKEVYSVKQKWNKVRNKNMLDMLFWKITSVKTSCFEKSWNDKLRVVSCELRVVSCDFKKVTLGVASYFLRVAVLKK